MSTILILCITWLQVYGYFYTLPSTHVPVSVDSCSPAPSPLFLAPFWKYKINIQCLYIILSYDRWKPNKRKNAEISIAISLLNCLYTYYCIHWKKLYTFRIDSDFCCVFFVWKMEGKMSRPIILTCRTDYLARSRLKKLNFKNNWFTVPKTRAQASNHKPLPTFTC